MVHKALPPSWKLTVYRSILQLILLYALENAQLSLTQITKSNHIDFKSLWRIFGIKSSFYHRVINPSDENCLNQYLAGLSFSIRVITPSQPYSQNRLMILGHLYRHPQSLEYHSTFMPSGQYRYTRGPNRVGRPRLHWAESVPSEASSRIIHLNSDQAPHITISITPSFTFRISLTYGSPMSPAPLFGWTTPLSIVECNHELKTGENGLI